MASNCPNCGAPFDKNAVCAYCGTVNPDISTVLAGKPVRIAYEVDGRVLQFTVVLDRISFEYRYDRVDFHDWSGEHMHGLSFNAGSNVTLEGALVTEMLDGRPVYLMER